MCNLFTLAKPVEKITGLFEEIDAPESPTPLRFSIRPGEPVATILRDEQVRLTFTQWGLVPTWAKDPEMGRRLYNARSETLKEKPSFKGPFRRHRCLILADGFYEFRKVPGKPWRQPTYFQLKSKQVFALAGLWDHWQSADGSELVTSTMITTTPNELVRPVHHRMPVILPPATYHAWLDRDIERPADLEPLLVPYPADEMTRVDVSSLIDRNQVDDASCIEPVPAVPKSTQLGLFGNE